ncbi:unnamed protein product [Bathycoccus prasinos]
MGKSILRDEGNGLKFPYWDVAAGGNANEPDDAGESPGKSSLSFNSIRALESHHTSVVSGALSTALEGLGKPRYRSHPLVLITASGLQGEQPLVDRKNVGKGSRQNRSVTSGKGLALRVGSRSFAF